MIKSKRTLAQLYHCILVPMRKFGCYMQLKKLQKLKTKLFINILFILFSIISFGQNKETDSLKHVISQLKLNQIEKDSLTSILIKQSETIKTNNEVLTNALNTNSNIFTGLSTYFTLIAILVSIIVIALPLVNYFFVLKPNKESLDKLEKIEIDLPKKIESEFGDYLNGFEKRKAKQLIKSLEDIKNLSHVVNFFFLSSFSDFDDEDQLRIVSFLKENKEIESMDRRILNSILQARPSLISENYYKSVIQDDEVLDNKEAIEYLIDNNAESNIRFWEIIISASENGHKILLDIFNHIYEYYLGNPFDKKTPEKKEVGESLTKLFFNNKTICDSVEQKSLPNKYKNTGDININTINWNSFLEDTLYIKNNFEGKRRKKSSS